MKACPRLLDRTGITSNSLKMHAIASYMAHQR